MFKAIIPPVCLLLALALAITGFAVIAFGEPEASVSLHAARANGDETTTDTLEEDLKRRQTSRMVMIALLFAASGGMALLGFGAMSGPSRNPKQS